jgi:hypothetical protein
MMLFQNVVVPDVVGMPFALACRMADQVDLVVTGLGPDGRGVDTDSEDAVLTQDPVAGSRAKRGARLLLHTGGRGGHADDREPLTPLPLEHDGHRDVTDPDADAELEGVPV